MIPPWIVTVGIHVSVAAGEYGASHAGRNKRGIGESALAGTGGTTRKKQESGPEIGSFRKYGIHRGNPARGAQVGESGQLGIGHLRAIVLLAADKIVATS